MAPEVAMGEAVARLLTVDEFLAWDDGTDRRHQLLRGVVTMMAPPQAVHGRLVSRLDRLLGRGLQPPCEPVTEAGIKPAHRGDTYYQADLAVTCRPLERGQVYLVDPVLIVEVLSPSTAATDRLLKLDDYRLIPALGDILFVSSTQVRVEHWHRQGDVWVVAVRGAGEQLHLAAFGLAIDLDALYGDLPIEAEPPPEAAIG
jgi:Uma2 family endonuclease